MADVKLILSILNEASKKKFNHIAPYSEVALGKLSDKQIEKASKSYKTVIKREDIIAFYGCSLFNSGTNAFVFTKEGMYTDWLHTKTKFLRYDDVEKVSTNDKYKCKITYKNGKTEELFCTSDDFLVYFFKSLNSKPQEAKAKEETKTEPTAAPAPVKADPKKTEAPNAAPAPAPAKVEAKKVEAPKAAPAPAPVKVEAKKVDAPKVAPAPAPVKAESRIKDSKTKNIKLNSASISKELDDITRNINDVKKYADILKLEKEYRNIAVEELRFKTKNSNEEFFTPEYIDANDKDDGRLKYVQFGGIVWIVVGEDYENTLLLAEKIVTKRPFHNTANDAYWYKSNIRDWLNREFIKRFSDKERELIDVYHNRIEMSPEVSHDKVFLLSNNMIKNYHIDRRALVCYEKWFLGNPHPVTTESELDDNFKARHKISAEYVLPGGSFWIEGMDPGDECGIRPAIFVPTKKLKMYKRKQAELDLVEEYCQHKLQEAKEKYKSLDNFTRDDLDDNKVVNMAYECIKNTMFESKEAALFVCDMYGGTPPKDVNGLDLSEYAAEMGSEVAMNIASLNYRQLFDLPGYGYYYKDKYKEYLNKAVEYNLPGAQFTMAKDYLNGEPFGKNLVKAYDLFKKAEAAGIRKAKPELEAMEPYIEEERKKAAKREQQYKELAEAEAKRKANEKKIREGYNTYLKNQNPFEDFYYVYTVKCPVCGSEHKIESMSKLEKAYFFCDNENMVHEINVSNTYSHATDYKIKTVEPIESKMKRTYAIDVFDDDRYGSNDFHEVADSVVAKKDSNKTTHETFERGEITYGKMRVSYIENEIESFRCNYKFRSFQDYIEARKFLMTSSKANVAICYITHDDFEDFLLQWISEAYYDLVIFLCDTSTVYGYDNEEYECIFKGKIEPFGFENSIILCGSFAAGEMDEDDVFEALRKLDVMVPAIYDNSSFKMVVEDVLPENANDYKINGYILSGSVKAKDSFTWYGFGNRSSVKVEQVKLFSKVIDSASAKDFVSLVVPKHQALDIKAGGIISKGTINQYHGFVVDAYFLSQDEGGIRETLDEDSVIDCECRINGVYIQARFAMDDFDIGFGCSTIALGTKHDIAVPLGTHISLTSSGHLFAIGTIVQYIDFDKEE